MFQAKKSENPKVKTQPKAKPKTSKSVPKKPTAKSWNAGLPISGDIASRNTLASRNTFMGNNHDNKALSDNRNNSMFSKNMRNNAALSNNNDNKTLSQIGFNNHVVIIDSQNHAENIEACRAEFNQKLTKAKAQCQAEMQSQLELYTKEFEEMKAAGRRPDQIGEELTTKKKNTGLNESTLGCIIALAAAVTLGVQYCWEAAEQTRNAKQFNKDEWKEAAKGSVDDRLDFLMGQLSA